MFVFKRVFLYAQVILAVGIGLGLSACQTPIDIHNNEIPAALRAQAEAFNGNYTVVYNYILNERREVGSLSVRNANGRFEITGDFGFLGQGWEFSQVTRIFWPEAQERAMVGNRNLLVILEVTRPHNGQLQTKSLNLSVRFDAQGRLENRHTLSFYTRSSNNMKHNASVYHSLQVIRN